MELWSPQPLVALGEVEIPGDFDLCLVDIVNVHLDQSAGATCRISSCHRAAGLLREVVQ